MQELDQEVVGEFLVESHENLSRLDQELVALEKDPQNTPLLASIFRTMHTIKGTCGFLGFTRLEAISHEAENLLSQLRDGKRAFTPTLGSLVLETVDATRAVLGSIEKSGSEGTADFGDLIARLRAAAEQTSGDETAAHKPATDAASSDSAGSASAGSDSPLTDSALPDPPVAYSAATDPVKDDKVHAEAPAAAEEPVRPRADETAPKPVVSEANIRVGVALLDKLMDLVGELVLTRNQILQCNSETEDAALNATSQRLNLITTELQEGVMKTRMQPIRVVWSQLPRVVRDMSLALGKQIRLELEGEETEIDRSIIEAIRDPLVHLVRNSCDHGFERPEERRRAGKPAEGMLALRAYHEGGQVNIEIADDGAGISVQRVKQHAVEKGLLRSDQAEKLNDRDALNLIFQPGFSTARTITNVSGRGVGMDVVKSHIDRIGGVVDLSTRPGQGTVVRLKIPLTLAIIPGLVVSTGGERFVIPQVNLLELVHVDAKCIENVHGTRVYRRRGTLLPLAWLHEVLGLASRSDPESLNIVVLQAEDRQFGLVVDSISDTQEIVVKPLGRQLKGLSVYAGATIMGDGRVALILDVPGTGRLSGVLTSTREQNRSAAEQQTQTASEKQRLLLFGAGSFRRLAVPLALVSRLEKFPHSSVERAAGGLVVQYRDRILPLLSLRSLLEPAARDGDAHPSEPVHVIVFHMGERSVGLLVDHIVDILEEVVTVRQKTGHPGILGSAIVGQQVTDFLDLNFVLRTAPGEWLVHTQEKAHGERILLAEGSAFSRGLMRSQLEMEGYRVTEASSEEDVLRQLERPGADVIVAALDLPPGGARSLAASLLANPKWQQIPVLGLAQSAEQMKTADGAFRECQQKFDDEAVLASVARLSAGRQKEAGE